MTILDGDVTTTAAWGMSGISVVIACESDQFAIDVVKHRVSTCTSHCEHRQLRDSHRSLPRSGPVASIMRSTYVILGPCSPLRTVACGAPKSRCLQESRTTSVSAYSIRICHHGRSHRAMQRVICGSVVTPPNLGRRPPGRSDHAARHHAPGICCAVRLAASGLAPAQPGRYRALGQA